MFCWGTDIHGLANFTMQGENASKGEGCGTSPQFINDLTVWLLTAITLPLCILIVSLVIWIRAGSLAAHPARYRLIGLAALVAGIVIDAAFMGCLLLWALGIIAMYESALLIAVIISISILVLVVIVMRRGLRLALSGFGPAGG